MSQVSIFKPLLPQEQSTPFAHRLNDEAGARMVSRVEVPRSTGRMAGVTDLAFIDQDADGQTALGPASQASPQKRKQARLCKHTHLPCHPCSLSLSLAGLLTAAVSSARREHSDSLHHPSTTAQRFSHSGELVCLYSRVHDHFRHNDIAAKHQ